MTEMEFFKYYAKDKNKNSESYLNSCKNHLEKLYEKIPEIFGLQNNLIKLCLKIQ